MDFTGDAGLYFRQLRSHKLLIFVDLSYAIAIYGYLL